MEGNYVPLFKINGEYYIRVNDMPKLIDVNPEDHPVLEIKSVRFDGPATIVFWEDGTKTVVKCTEKDLFNKETGIAMATLKKIFGESYSVYKREVSKLVKKDEEMIKKAWEKMIKEEKDPSAKSDLIELMHKLYGMDILE